MAVQDEHVPAVEQAVRDAVDAYLTRVRTAIVEDGRVELAAWPADDAWRTLLDEHVASLLARIWQDTFDSRQRSLSRPVTAAVDPDDYLSNVSPGRSARQWVTAFLDAWSDALPTVVYQVVQSVIEVVNAARVTAGQVVTRVEAALQIDAPDSRVRTRMGRLESIIDDPSSTPEQRRRARADLVELQSGIRVDEREWTAEVQQMTRDAVQAAYNAADIEGARTWADASGEQLIKEWLATDDARTRPSHVEADGQRVPLNESFEVGAARLDYPQDPAAPPGERINCRCTMLFIESEEYE